MDTNVPLALTVIVFLNVPMPPESIGQNMSTISPMIAKVTIITTATGNLNIICQTDDISVSLVTRNSQTFHRNPVLINRLLGGCSCYDSLLLSDSYY